MTGLFWLTVLEFSVRGQLIEAIAIMKQGIHYDGSM
jgi:hypothetical protein